MLQAIIGGKKTVDGVLGVFNKAISDLAQVRVDNLNNAEIKRTEAEALLAEASAAEEEAKRADAVMGKLQGIIGTEAGQSAYA